MGGARRIQTADQLLRAYAEEKEKLSSPAAQNLVAHHGGICGLRCANAKCPGKPMRVSVDGSPTWRCTGCRKPWPIEERDLLRNEFDDTHRGVPSIGNDRIRLGDFALILERVRKAVPSAYIAWTVHVLAPAYFDEGRPRGLGIPVDAVPARLRELMAAGEIPPLKPEPTLYRVAKWWLPEARKRTMALVWKGGL